MYSVSYIERGARHRSRSVRAHSLAEVRRLIEAWLGYRDWRSAYEYTAPSKYGEDAVFYCRRKDSYGEDFNCVEVVRCERK
mgnify:CR=1 FL=1